VCAVVETGGVVGPHKGEVGDLTERASHVTPVGLCLGRSGRPDTPERPVPTGDPASTAPLVIAAENRCTRPGVPSHAPAQPHRVEGVRMLTG
jgi:hypothetical protein